MQCNSTRLTTGTLLNFLGFFKKITPACRPAACKKFQRSQLRYLLILDLVSPGDEVITLQNLTQIEKFIARAVYKNYFSE